MCDDIGLEIVDNVGIEFIDLCCICDDVEWNVVVIVLGCVNGNVVCVVEIFGISCFIFYDFMYCLGLKQLNFERNVMKKCLFIIFIVILIVLLVVFLGGCVGESLEVLIVFGKDFFVKNDSKVVVIQLKNVL